MTPIFSPLTKQLGIDIGSAMTRVYSENRGVVLTEPSIVATDARRESIIAVGSEAELMLRRSTHLVEALSPFHDGVIADYRVTRTMLQQFIKKSIGKGLVRSRIMLTVPCGITDVEKRAMTDAVLQLGSREVCLIASPVIAALGEGMPIFEPVGNLIADIGCGTTDVMAISMGGIVRERSTRVGGNLMNQAISRYLREQFNVMVSEATVEQMKLSLASALPPEDGEDGMYHFKGRDSTNGLTKQLTIRRSELYSILSEPIGQIIEGIRSVLEQLPPEMCVDILESGMLLTGGVARMEGLSQRIATELGIPVRTPEEPELAVVRGFGRAFKEKALMRRLLVSARDRKGRS